MTEPTYAYQVTISSYVAPHERSLGDCWDDDHATRRTFLSLASAQAFGREQWVAAVSYLAECDEDEAKGDPDQEWSAEEQDSTEPVWVLSNCREPDGSHDPGAGTVVMAHRITLQP